MKPTTRAALTLFVLLFAVATNHCAAEALFAEDSNNHCDTPFHGNSSEPESSSQSMPCCESIANPAQLAKSGVESVQVQYILPQSFLSMLSAWEMNFGPASGTESFLDSHPSESDPSEILISLSIASNAPPRLC